VSAQFVSKFGIGSARTGGVPIAWHVRNWLGVAFISAVFIVSRAAYYAKGIRFDTATLDYIAQLLDRVLLRTRLLESIYYLHSQPPLYNLLTGVALKLAPHRPEILLWPLFMAAGLYTSLCLNFIMNELRVPWWIASAAAAAMAISPAFVLYENWYFYPHLNVALLCGALAWLCHSRGCPGKSLLLSAAHLVCLSLTRSLFHPLFYALATILAVTLSAPSARARTFACFAGPGLLVLLWCGKNLLIFGFFGTSSWASRNLSQSVANLLGAERIQSEVRLGHLSKAAGLSPFESGERLVEVFGVVRHTPNVPALVNARKTHESIYPDNYNHWSYPPTARFYAADTRHLLAQFPLVYLKGVAQSSVRVFFNPVEDGFVSGNQRHIFQLAQAFDELEGSSRGHWLLGIGIAFAVFAMPWLERRRRLVLAFCLLAICWVVLVGTFADYGENYRFRYKVLWLGWAVAVSGYFMAARGLIRASREAARAIG